MKKYLFIYHSEFLSNVPYLFNLLSGFIGYFIHILIFLNLWEYIYSDPNEIIHGYTMSQMIWYVIFTEILWSVLSGRKLCRKISDDVRSGNIAYNMNKPYSYIGYTLFSHLGDVSMKVILFVPLAILVGFLFLGMFPDHSILSLLLVVVSAILALVISILLITLIGLVSFFVEDANPFYWLYSKLILILGTLFPIEYFPTFLQPVLNYSPVYVVTYGPAKLFTNFSCSQAISVLLVQLIYLIVVLAFCKLLYEKGVKHLNVNGG